MYRTGVVAITLLALCATPLGEASYSAIEWATPTGKDFTLPPGLNSFEVEVECESDDSWESDYVWFQLNGQSIEADENLAGWSPSFIYWLWAPGSYQLGAYCISEDGTKGQPNDKVWNVDVQAGQTALRSPACSSLADPDSFAAPEGWAVEWTTNQLRQSSDVWHRSGPWACEFVGALEPLDFALQVNTILLDVRHDLQEVRFCDDCGSAWDVAVDFVPQIGPLWVFFETLYPVLATAVDALQALESMAELRLAAIDLLRQGSQASLEAFQAAIPKAIQAYDALLSHLENAIQFVLDLAEKSRNLAEYFWAIGEEAAESDWAYWAADVFYTISRQASIVEDLFAAGASALGIIGGPLDADRGFLSSLLAPPLSPEPGDSGSADGTTTPAANTNALPIGIAIGVLLALSRFWKGRNRP